LHGVSSSPSAEAFKDIVAGLGSGSIAPEAAAESAPEEASAGLEGAVSEGAMNERSASADLLSMLDAAEGVSKKESAPVGSPPSGGVQEQQLFTPEPVEVTPPANLDGATDDWDALLDSVSSDSSPAEPAAPSASGLGNEALVEAEQLMQELGQTAGDVSSSVPAESAATPSLLPTYTSTTPSSPELDGDLAYDYSATPARRRSKRHSRTARRGRKAIKFIAAVTALVACIAAAYVYVVRPRLEQAEDLEAKAERLRSESRYEEASKAYTKLSSDPIRGAEAQFQAAYVLTLEAPGSRDARDRRYSLALTRFTSFIEDNPQHPKRTRAQTIMGRLHYELTEYDKAISILLDQVDPLDDPQAALATYRFLARSYSQIADYEAAESAFLLAALLPGNYSVDTDYRELGGMFQTRADLAKTDEERVAFMDTAVDYWRKAIQQPGIEPGQKAALEEKLDWFVFQDSEGGMASAKDVSSTTGESEAKVSVPLASGSERSPVDGDHEEAPGAEFPTLEMTDDSAPKAE
jgi:hypothetical protein